MTAMPDIVGDIWFNSEPLHRGDLANKVILVNFCTHTCIDCRLTMPYMKSWWGKYRDKGFLVIGIHTPEFEFEKDPAFMAGVIENMGAKWPVVLDNDRINCDKFGNRHWPAWYLVNRKGNIVYSHTGEVAVTRPFMYNLLKTDEPIQGTLTIEAEQGAFQAYAFTFSGCVD